MLSIFIKSYCYYLTELENKDDIFKRANIESVKQKIMSEVEEQLEGEQKESFRNSSQFFFKKNNI